MRLDELADRCGRHDTSVIVEIGGSGTRREMTHTALGLLAQAWANHLAASGLRPGHVVGIRARNGIDWIAWDLATTLTGVVLQAFPDETPITDADRFLEQHGLALLVTDEEPVTGHPCVLAAGSAPHSVVVSPWARQLDNPDLHSLVYSSGTSGTLKGLQISRKGVEYVITRFIECFAAAASDRHLIFLPLSNFQQRLSAYCCLWLGADLVLAPYQRVFSAVRTERPTFMIAPPVFYDTTLQLHGRDSDSGSLGDFLGGRIRFLITGMAPIRRPTLAAFWASGVCLLEAYGLTESGMIAWNTPDSWRLGSVGKLIDPDAVTFLPDGELLIHRPAPLSIGYFDADAGTARETFRPDGAISTGDYGRLDDDGFLTLLGRKKDVIVLGSGRKVNPAEVEAMFAGIGGITELIVVPTPRSGRLGAIITPATHGDESLRSAICRQIEVVNQALDSHQRIAATMFSEQPLHGDRRFMTGNMKLSRRAAAAYFAEHVTAGPEVQPAATSDRNP